MIVPERVTGWSGAFELGVIIPTLRPAALLWQGKSAEALRESDKLLAMFGVGKAVTTAILLNQCGEAALRLRDTEGARCYLQRAMLTVKSFRRSDVGDDYNWFWEKEILEESQYGITEALVQDQIKIGHTQVAEKLFLQQTPPKLSGKSIQGRPYTQMLHTFVRLLSETGYKELSTQFQKMACDQSHRDDRVNAALRVHYTRSMVCLVAAILVGLLAITWGLKSGGQPKMGF